MILLPLFLLEVIPDRRWCVFPSPRHTEYKVYLSLIGIRKAELVSSGERYQ